MIRPLNEFNIDNFSNLVFKYVRNGHVQSDEHWTKNWKKATLIK